MNRLDALKSIADQAAKGQLVFPTNLNASLKIRQALDDPNCHMEAAAKLIQAEPLLAARTVAVANSAAYNRSGMEITNVRAATVRLGFGTLRSLAAALVVRQFSAQVADPKLKAKSRQLWEHSAHVAALANVIARRVTHLDPEAAMFAGIVHEVGGFYLLSRAHEFPGILDGDPDDWTEFGEAEIGRAVLKKLAVPETVMDAIEAMWDGFLALPPETMGDTLLLANDLAPVTSPLHQSPDAASTESTSKIDYEIGDGTLNDILQESAEEVESLYAALLN
jgi:HD-like signal output (HDOD) protein